MRTINHVETWLFDLDNTLYPASVNLFGQMDQKMNAFIQQALGLDAGRADQLRRHYFYSYGTTLRGLMRDYGVDPHAFTEFVHEIDVGGLEPAPALDMALDALPGRKVIFTNGSVAHAERVMARLGVARHFDAIFDIAAGDFVPKPSPEPYRTVVSRFGLEATRTVMIDDVARNLAPAASLGMTTVWIRSSSPYSKEGSDGDHIHHVADDLAAWLTALPVSADGSR